MHLKPLTSDHAPALTDLHAKMRMPYQFDPNNGFAMAAGAFNGSESPIAAVLGRPALEVYFLLDKQWSSPQERWEVAQHLSQHFDRDARAQGYVELFSMIPPEVEASFKKRLFALGWQKQLWSCWSKELG